MSCLQNEIILENIYEEIVAESIKNLSAFGIYVTVSELDHYSIDKEVYNRFEDLSQ